ncbi:MAG: hypothetical protein OCC45_16120 [Desulfotalea sp.]
MANKKKGTLMIALLITGNLIGAGILALPIQTGGAGLFLTFIAMIIFSAAMYFSAIVLAKEAIESREENFNYPSLYEKYLGKTGKWIATFANLLILYGLLTAYIGGGASIISSAISDIINLGENSNLIVTLVLFIILSAFTATGTSFVTRYNQFLMLFLGLTFAFLVFMGLGKIEPNNLLRNDLRFLPLAIPVILTAFHFHNIIPTICKDMNWDLAAISKAMKIGMSIGFCMNLIWVIVGLGILPLTTGNNSLLYSYLNGLPATLPIGNILGSNIFSAVAIAFSLTAICTSYAANGIGLMDFNRDLLGQNKIKILIATFLPPLIIALAFPTIFLKAIGVVGGVGIAMLFGILPAVIFYIKNKNLYCRLLAIVIGLLFLIAMTVDLANDIGIIKAKEIIESLQIEQSMKNTQ